MPAAAQFDHEKLDAYQIQLQFIRWTSAFFEELRDAKHRRIAEVLDQLDRASLSVLLNIAEGNGRRASQQRVRFFDDARGSATECAACLDALIAKGAADVARVLDGKALLLRVVSVLTKLIEWFTASPEERARYGRVSEDEFE
ncbi:MAG TPA: four helix bundle protein [Chthoniobacteraceae bacterium]|jgi:four helix bundle protein